MQMVNISFLYQGGGRGGEGGGDLGWPGAAQCSFKAHNNAELFLSAMGHLGIIINQFALLLGHLLHSLPMAELVGCGTPCLDICYIACRWPN